jgi:hypothetical protein
LLPFVPNKTPHLIHFSFLNLLDDDVQESRRSLGDGSIIYSLNFRLFFSRVVNSA